MADQISWTLDASLETFEPGFVHTEAQERQMQVGVNLKNTNLPGGEDSRIDMRLTCIIQIQSKTGCVAEISAASIVNLSQYGQAKAECEEKLYQHVRSNLEGLLQVAHYAPPLPARLSDIHQ